MGYYRTLVKIMISIHMSTNAEILVKIDPIFAEIFGGICQFLSSSLPS